MVLETLTAAPATLPLLARAALTARGRSGTTVPDRTLRLADVRVDRDRLARYQRLTGFPVGDTLPATYPWVLAFPVQNALLTRRDFPLPLPGMVHLENRVGAVRRIDAAEPLTLEVTARGIRPHRKGRLLDVRIEAHVGEEPVWSCDSVYLSRGRGTDDAPRGEVPPEPPTGPPLARWTLPEDLGREYAAVSGDVNPIHLHPLTARAMGFRRHLAHGMWTSARTIAALGPGVTGTGSHRVWFTRPVFLPARVELVADRDPDGTVLAAVRPAGRPGRPDGAHLVLAIGRTADAGHRPDG